MNKTSSREDQIRGRKNKDKYLLGYRKGAVNSLKQWTLNSLQNHQTLSMNKFATAIEASNSKAKLSNPQGIKLPF